MSWGRPCRHASRDRPPAASQEPGCNRWRCVSPWPARGWATMPSLLRSSPDSGVQVEPCTFVQVEGCSESLTTAKKGFGVHRPRIAASATGRFAVPICLAPAHALEPFRGLFQSKVSTNQATRKPCLMMWQSTGIRLQTVHIPWKMLWTRLDMPPSKSNTLARLVFSFSRAATQMPESTSWTRSTLDALRSKAAEITGLPLVPRAVEAWA